MTTSPLEIFGSIKDKEFLQSLAEKRGIELTDKAKKNVTKELANDVLQHGLKKTLELLPHKLLVKFDVMPKEEPVSDGKGKSKEPKEHKHSKIVLVKQAHKLAFEDPHGFLAKYDTSFLGEILDALDFKKPKKDDSKEYASAIIDHSNEVGLENCLASLTIPQLQLIAEAQKLNIDSSAQGVLIDHIMSGEDYEKAKPKKVVAPSKKKPEIHKGITKADLNQHYWRQDLVEWCKKNDLKVSGNKKELIDRILDHLAGKEKPLPKKRKASTSPAKEKPAKKQKTTSS